MPSPPDDAGHIPKSSGADRREWIAARTRAGLTARTARARLSGGRDRADLDALQAHRRVVREQQRQRAVRGVRGKLMNERNFVHIGHIKDVSTVLRLLDELREDLNDAKAPTSTIETVDDLRVEARKPKPSKDITGHLMEKLADRGLGEQMKELEKAFDALF
ncbi:hypothetical protein ABZX92_00360 [Lentzea sp. NPDC006480]|uniref:hypothetical protein n=1 Tax=Lentzea sp. NPDC006480 TaxID=3157176 RepID=UPI0033A9D54B